MNQKELTLTQGSLGKSILLFSLPLMASNLLQVLFNMADIAVIGRFGGSMSLGAVGSTTTLVALFTGLLIGISSGINVLVARYLGANDQEDIRETVHSAAVISLIVGLLLLLSGILFTHGVLKLLNTKPELMDGALLYLRIYFLGMPALALYNFGNAVYSAVGNTRKSLCYLTVAGIINIVLNLFFVIICRLDVVGVALASVIAQYISAFLIITALFRSQEIYALRLSRLHLYPGKTQALLKLGIPCGIQTGVFQVANLFIQVGVNTFDATMVAANSAAANADPLVYDVMAAFYMACSSFIGQNYGAGKKDRIRRSYLISVGYSFGAGLVLGLLLLAFGPAFLSLFTDEPAVIEAGMRRLNIMALSYGVSAFMDCTISAARGLGKSLAPMVIVILGSCVFRVAWVYTVFAHFRTIPSLYLLYVFSWTITGVAEIWYFIRAYRKETAGMA